MKRIIFLLLLFVVCGAAYGQFTKPQLYDNIDDNIRLKTYSPLRISAVLDSLVKTMGSVATGGTNITSYAIGDLIQATGPTTLSRLASVSAGSYLRSAGVTTSSAWSTVKLPDTMSALGLWVANSANTTVNLTAAAGESIRVNAGGTAWEAYTPGSGGSDTEVQFNDGGSFGGDAGFVYNKTTNVGTIGGLNVSGLTASELVATDGSKNLQSLAVATYPSLTELSYVKGLTSAAQTQIDTKLNKAGDTYTTTTGNGLALTSSTVTSGNLVHLSNTGTAAASNTKTVLRVASSGANATSTQTTYGAHFSNTNTGTSSTNYGSFHAASGGTTNYAIGTSGNVNIGGGLYMNGNPVFTLSGSNQIELSPSTVFYNGSLVLRSGSTSPVTIGNAVTTIPSGALTLQHTNTMANTSGTSNMLLVGNGQSFAPTSGTAIFNGILWNNTINQTGGANGQITGFNGTPVLTSAVNVTGFRWAPTVTSVTGTHLAFHATSGDIKLNSGNIILGDAATAGALKSISVAGSASNISLDLVPKGSSPVQIGSRYFQIGRSTDGDTFRTISSEGSETNITLDIYSKGTLGWIDVNGTFQVYDINNPTGERASFQAINYAGLRFDEGNSFFRLRSTPAGGTAADLVIQAGYDTGKSSLYLDVQTGGPDEGNIGFMTTSVSNWQNMDRGFFEGDAGTAPTANPTSGIFRWVSSEPEGSNMKIRTTGGHFAKPVLQAKVTIAGGATLQAIGSVPQTIIAAPGAGKYINVISASVSYNYISAVYNFSGTEVPVFKYSGGAGSAFAIPVSVINGGADYNRSLGRFNTDSSQLGGIVAPDNTAFVFTTDDAGDATTGDGDIDIVVYYTIETTNN